MSCKIICIVNQKGGVGKTTTAGNLATALAAVGKRVLLIDNDPQGNTTSGFGISKEGIKTLYDVMLGSVTLGEIVVTTCVPGLFLAPADINLAAVEVELVGLSNFRTILKKSLESIKEQYDYVLIDCPPALGLLTINALTASSSILIPLQCEFFALEGLKHLIGTIKLVKENLNSSLRINGILLTMYDRRNNMTLLIEKDVRECLGEVVYKAAIPRNVRLSEAGSHGQPILIYDKNCSGSLAYIEMTKEFLRRELTNQDVVV